MSLLENHKGSKIKITGYLGARVPAQLEKDFKQYCDNLKITVADALRLLVENELNSSGQKNPAGAPVAEKGGQLVGTKADTLIIDEYATADKAARPSMPLPAGPQTKTNNIGGRFTVKQWQRNGLLPCPICGEWKSHANFARHAKTEHNSTTKELFQQHASRADQMAAEYDEKSRG